MPTGEVHPQAAFAARVDKGRAHADSKRCLAVVLPGSPAADSAHAATSPDFTLYIPGRIPDVDSPALAARPGSLRMFQTYRLDFRGAVALGHDPGAGVGVALSPGSGAVLAAAAITAVTEDPPDRSRYERWVTAATADTAVTAKLKTDSQLR